MQTRKTYSHSKKASALLFAMLIVGLLMLMGIFLLERILPASRDTKGIELGNAAYYFAESAEEDALAFMNGGNPFIEKASSLWGGFTSTGNIYSIVAMTTAIPKTGEGNSEYDKNWNTISPGSPIQLRFNNSLDWNNPNAFKITLRIPQNWTANGYTSFVNTGSGIINWTLSDGSGSVLIGSGSSILMPADINGASFSLQGKHGSDISSDLPSAQIGQDTMVGTFSNNNLLARCATQKCTVRFSIVNSLNVQKWSGETTILPYLEYQISTNTPIPEQYASIKTEGYFRGFRKTTIRKVRQLTGNEALDFAVFQ